MKRFQQLAIASAIIVSVCSAFTQRQPLSNHEYALSSYNATLNRYYFHRDLTADGFFHGLDYLCNTSAGGACTFLANPFEVQYDGTNYYFDASDVLVTQTNKTYVEF